MKLNLCPLGVSYLLARKLGHQKAFELCAFSKLIDAHQARAMGLVNQVVPDHLLKEEALRVAFALCDLSPLALSFCKVLHVIQEKGMTISAMFLRSI